MQIPPSPHVLPVDLARSVNARRSELPDPLCTPVRYREVSGEHSLRGIACRFGDPSSASDVILLAEEPVTVDLQERTATYLLFLHAVEDRPSNYAAGFADTNIDGNELGDHVATYTLEYADGTSHATPILRRFAIQQSRVQWGASAFAAVPANAPNVSLTASDDVRAHGSTSQYAGRGENRHASGRDTAGQHLWLYALPNPHPEKPIRSITCTPGLERAVIYSISTTRLAEHPLRSAVRRKLRLDVPGGTALNAIGELEGVDVDLGTVISARAALDYDRTAWLGSAPNVQPQQSTTQVIVEYAAHPHARLHVAAGGGMVTYDLAGIEESTAGMVSVAPAHRPVHIRTVDKQSGQPVAVRLHLHGEHGEYLPPKGFHRKVNAYWFEDNYAEHVTGLNQYAYIHGECIADLPLGDVFLEATRGYEVAPVRTVLTITPETDEITIELDNVLDWRSNGWVTADTHVHFLSPQTARLEGEAEGVNVVNLLASQWGEMFSNVGDFDGRTTIGAKEFGGDGEFLVRVGTENRMQVLGHISLLGYSGSMIHPLCTGGPSESAIGDPLEVTMAEWAERCIKQGGLVVMPHAPNPQLERAADLVLGLVNAVEMMTFNPMTPDSQQVNPYGLADWYRYLNLGYHVPVVGGSDKMQAWGLLGGIRTYAHLGGREFTYENWMEAVRAGNTFVTVGPLVELAVNGQPAGSRIELPAGGGSVSVSWRVESAGLPVDQIEVVVGGLTTEQVNLDSALAHSGSTEIQVDESTWIALRVRGSYKGRHGEIAAHSSAVQIVVDGKPLFSRADAFTVLEQIEGAIAYVDTLAPRPEAARYKQLRATLEAAHNRLHQRMHRQGIYHQHTVLHAHEQQHEH